MPNYIEREAWFNGARPNGGAFAASTAVRYGEQNGGGPPSQGQDPRAAQTVAYQTNLIRQLQAALKATVAERDSLAAQVQSLRSGAAPVQAVPLYSVPGAPAGQQTVEMRVVRKPRPTHTPGQGPQVPINVPADEEQESEM